MNETWGSRWREGGIPLLALVLMASLLRVWRLDAPLWLDEVLMMHDFVQGPWINTITTYPTDNQHPLYSFAAHLSAQLFGESAFAIRLPAVLFGVLGIGFAYVMGRRFLSKPASLWATAALALSPHHIWFSQNARGYTALALFATLALDAWMDVLRGSRKGAVYCGAALALAIWTHLTGVFIAAGLFVSWLVHIVANRGDQHSIPRNPRSLGLVALVIGALGALALHVPMLDEMVTFFTGPKSPRPVSAWRSPWWTLEELVRGLGSGSFALGCAAVAVGAATILYGCVTLRRRAPGFVSAALSPLVLAPLITFALGRHLWPRFFFAQATPLALIATAGLSSALADRVPKSLLKLGSVAVLLGLLPLLPHTYATKQDFPAAKTYVETLRAPTDRVVTIGTAYWAYSYYYAPEYRGANEVATFQASLDERGRAWVISASPIFVESYRPDIFKVLTSRCERVAVFPSALGHVEVYRER